jgi:cyclopropane fatty-acyl-phospholipid synthase-like methyltransferase
MQSILALPHVYRLFGILLGAPRRNRILLEKYVRLKANDRVLDIGCGPGDLIRYLPRVEYAGFDANQQYINAALLSFGDRATFTCARVSTYLLTKPAYFDVALSVGVLHHLTDEEAVQMFRLAHTALKLGGRLITLDGCIAERQHWMTRYLVSKDRGRHLRTSERYLQMASEVFSTVAVHVRDDLLRIPYTLSILECTR